VSEKSQRCSRRISKKKRANSTFLGGTDIDRGEGSAVRDRNAYVTGTTSSADYPTTPGAFDTTPNFVDAFVTKLPIG
jgi:hypothetical protein